MYWPSLITLWVYVRIEFISFPLTTLPLLLWTDSTVYLYVNKLQENAKEICENNLQFYLMYFN